MKYLAMFLVLYVIYPQSVRAEEHNFSPASFQPDTKTLKQFIVFPETEEDISIRVLCSLGISQFGFVTQSVFFAKNNENKKYEDVIRKAVKNIRMKPAIYNGVARAVNIQILVEFIKFENIEIINVYPNNGLDTMQHGKNYISPQRVGSFSSINKYDCVNKSTITVSTITTDGEVKDFDAVTGDVSDFCKNKLTKNNTSLYIPGFSNGKPIEARYIGFTIHKSDARYEY